MESQDKFGEISNEYKSKLSALFRKYDIKEVKPVEELSVITQPISEETIEKVKLERWTVYSFTLPVAVSKRIAFGFKNKEKAQEFIEKHLVKRDENGEVITKKIEDKEGNQYIVKYDTIRESVEDVDLYYNDPEITTVGNDRDDVLKAWQG